MFEKATRLKLRFDTPAGILAVEDLWDLPLTSRAGHVNLDDLARACSREVKSTEESFVEKPAPKDKVAALRFKLVKHVIAIRLEERDEAKMAAAKRDRKAKLLEILAKKGDEKLEGMSEKEILAELEAL